MSLSPCFALILILLFGIEVEVFAKSLDIAKPVPENTTFNEVFSRCGTSRRIGCILLPLDHEDTSKECWDSRTKTQIRGEPCATAVMTEYLPDEIEESNTMFQFTIVFNLHPKPELKERTKVYAAIGLAGGLYPDMVDMLIMHCAYRDDRKHPPVLTSTTRYALTNVRPEETIRILVNGNVFKPKVEKTMLENGMVKHVKCVFHMPKFFTVEYQPGGKGTMETQVFDLEDTGYFIGFTSNHHPTCYSPQHPMSDICNHGPYPYYTENSVNLKQPVFQRGRVKSQWLVAVHGVLMIVSYMGLIPIATIIARFFRETWSERQFFQKRIWYMIHVILLSTAFILITFASFSIIFRNYEIWPERFGPKIHGIIGFLSYLILLSQVVLHFVITHECPVAKKTYSRIHAILGLLAYLLGVFNLLMSPLFLPTHVDCTMSLITSIYIPTHFTIWVFLATWMIITDHTMIGNQTRYRALNAYPMRIKTLEDAPGATLRIILLVIFIGCCITFVVAGSYVVVTWRNCAIYLQKGKRV